MFTGIVESLGEVTSISTGADSARIEIRAPKVLTDAVAGVSIAVNGVCLTVVNYDAEKFTADVMLETLNRSSLGELEVGSAVNVERAVPVSGRLGGHIVQGHVDGIAHVLAIDPHEEWTVLTIELPPSLAPYVIEKGSITVNGVSLTVASVTDPSADSHQFTVSLIPTTLVETNLGQAQVGQRVNIEVDALAKYMERIVAFRQRDES